MYKVFFYLWTTGVTVIFTAMAFDLSWAFYVQNHVYPVDLTAMETSDKKANRRPRHEHEELELREEDDADDNPMPSQPIIGNGDPVPDMAPFPVSLAAANPFLPVPAALPDIPKIGQPTDKERLAAAHFDARNFDVRAFSASEAGVTTAELTHCKAVIEKTLGVLPPRLTNSLDEMTLYFNRREPRGLSNSHVMELRCGELSDREIVAVLVHELGHVADLGAFRGQSKQPSGFVDGSIVIPTDDLSAQFYGLSWQDAKTQKFSATKKDFISGYAMSDPFEDFAESFIAYVLHGDDFRALTKESRILAKKYDFLKKHVFAHAEYESDRAMQDGKRVWDVTLVAYDVTGFWGEQNKKLAATE